VNRAFFDGMRSGGINSGSVMVPCPHFPEAAHYSHTHPDADIGLHLTLTSDEAPARWRPAAPQASVPSLLDDDGYFHRAWSSGIRLNLKEVELELRAQIEKAFAFGLRPTHLDSHQFILQQSGERIFRLYLGLAHDYGLPILASRESFDRYPYIGAAISGRDIVLDRVVTIGPSIAAGNWAAFYRRALETLPPGLTEFLIHPGYRDEELSRVLGTREEWGAAWRQRDLDFFVSAGFKSILEDQGIKLVTWREMGSRFPQN
jgi:predicted glycoside hydrolase/deacetylase ChbG (UPF0249 family)